MPCNAHNHPLNCDCGWGGQWHGNTSSGLRTGAGRSFTEYYVSPEIEWSFGNPNANCPECGVRVFFYSNANGSRVFFDHPGPPWPKHPCTNNTRLPSDFIYKAHLEQLKSRYAPKKTAKTKLDRDGWKFFKILKSKSFRLEIEHHGSGRKFETGIIKDKLPSLGAAVWIKEEDKNSVKISFFDQESFKPMEFSWSKFEARKYATISDWIAFDEWFKQV